MTEREIEVAIWVIRLVFFGFPAILLMVFLCDAVSGEVRRRKQLKEMNEAKSLEEKLKIWEKYRPSKD